MTLDHDVDSSEEEEPKASSSEVEDRSSGNEEKDVMDDIEPISEVPNTSAHHTNKPPTGAELRLMKDAIDLYQSSSFKLQVCLCFLVHLSRSGTHACVPDRRSSSKCPS